ncbi:uncharacterized protein LOC128218952 isoform X1 [Mya arenaria]|uniref:uncharacterized protein LOC128218952 isoform X1 n=1 Tax=Mya arenaria TaxID=6604 RepID=UPI0022E059A6|nr:uncharacterized protein LOC128218952 isoform X1 [Mya arenaria]
MVSSVVFDEMLFWQSNIKRLNCGKLEPDNTIEVPVVSDQAVVFCDASGAGFGGYVKGIDDSVVVGCWSETESGLSSTWRELEAVYRVLHSSVGCLEGREIIVNSDNKNVPSILKVGSKKPYLHDIALNVDNVCNTHNITLVPKWVPRENNTEADFPSRCTDSDDWSIKQFVFNDLERVWGPHTCDRFACSYNAKCANFNSKYWCPGTTSVDAFSVQWSGENNWLVPTPRLINDCIIKIKKEQCKATLLVPMWKSAPFWPICFQSDGEKAGFVHDCIVFQPRRLTRRGRGRNGIFDGRPLKFGFVALRFM